MELEYVPVDIETTGLYPVKDQLISWVCGEFDMIQSSTRDEKYVLNSLLELKDLYNKSTTTIITFMGGTMYSPGFDFPFLRTRCLINKQPWPFKGFNHIDLFPIIQKWFDLDFMELGTIEDLKANELTKMVISFGLKPEGNMKGNIAQAIELIEQEQINDYLAEKGFMKKKSHGGLKDACLHLLGIKGFGIDGKKVPGMFAEWKESDDDTIIESIHEYNKDDCIKTMALFEAVRGMVPNRVLSGELL